MPNLMSQIPKMTQISEIRIEISEIRIKISEIRIKISEIAKNPRVF